jgi:VanZ family protein
LAGISLLAVVVYWGAIFVATHVPALPSAAARMSDKVQHFGAYFLLAVLLIAAGRMLGFSRGKVYLAVLVVGVAYGMVDELTQLLVPNRTADPRDWAADMCGVAAACLVASLVEKLTVDGRQ